VEHNDWWQSHQYHVVVRVLEAQATADQFRIGLTLHIALHHEVVMQSSNAWQRRGPDGIRKRSDCMGATMRQDGGITCP
jgi:hypothetical protein